MISVREILFEKLQDFLTLEAWAAELHEEVIRSIEDSEIREALEKIRVEKLMHESLVNELPDQTRPYSAFREKTGRP